MSILRKGTRQQVYSGIAKQTAGGLTKKDLFLDGDVIKSKKASKSAKNNSKQLGGARTTNPKRKHKTAKEKAAKKARNKAKNKAKQAKKAKKARAEEREIELENSTQTSPMFNNANATIKAEEAEKAVELENSTQTSPMFNKANANANANSRKDLEQKLRGDLNAILFIFKNINEINEIIKKLDVIIVALGPKSLNNRESSTTQLLHNKTSSLGIAINDFEIDLIYKWVENLNRKLTIEELKKFIDSDILKNIQIGKLKNKNRIGRFDVLLCRLTGLGKETEALAILKDTTIDNYKKRNKMRKLIINEYIKLTKFIIPVNNNQNNQNNSLSNAYKILGLPINASTRNVTKRFRKLALQYHPNKHPGKSSNYIKETTEKFQKIQGAYKEITKNRSGN